MLENTKIINGSELKKMFVAGSHWLKAHMAYVNALNVFPVPDGDTGTNMFLTLKSALKNITPYEGGQCSELTELAANGALMGARGNSGVILSQILGGFAEALSGKDSMTVPDFANALQSAADKAYKAVADPVEGTILTVIKETARSAMALDTETLTVAEFLTSAVDTAQRTLRLTPELLPVLKEAGVVDSGGQGLVYFLEGMLRSVQDLSVEIEGDAADDIADALPISHEEHSEGYGYDVQFLILGEKLDIDTVRENIVGMGECPLVVGNDTTIKVHVHVPDPGVPISYGVSLGHIDDIVVENMELQSQEFYGEKDPSIIAEPTTDLATICVSPGDGFSNVFKTLGANSVISGGQTMNPSTQDFLAVINQLHVDKIIILPNNSNIVMTARQAASMTEKDVQVLPTKTLPQGIGALMMYRADGDIETNVSQMQSAMADVHTIEITRAVRTTTINDIPVQEGDIIGLLDGSLVVKGSSPTKVAMAVLSHADVALLEIITLYYGEDTTQSAAETLSNLIADTHTDLEVEVVKGGQPHYQFIISLE